ncbi:phosphatidylglycerol lysyltransferase domain-containing protein [Maritimibacter sp. UBA3975]|uniref:phosphatidylglycerol lysyltransferase domain-containing protein n=1 Tax=Maritimibacter sp. UBA3975 TaxID=1946833 RepID=UPI0025C1AF05|nr:phosphatidylglycerol lysyltransferase domain-containing protein [Maritimibacter sp. UBA3975]|tara:strand:+ start:4419 stop:6308 length:1890 start_codon:yes stop_codon:yes gene_type:complete
MERGRVGRAVLLRQITPLVVFGVLALLLRDRIAELDLAHIRASLGTVGPVRWALGIVLTGISFWALGQYDVVVHRLVGRDTDPRRAARSGMTAIAVGQTVGMGTLTGTFVRWRMLPGLGLLDATRISAIVTMSFFAAWAVLTAMSVLTFGVAVPYATPAAVAILILAYLCILLSVWRPGPLARWPLPPLKAIVLILGFTTVDTVAAGAVLWTMLPTGIEIGFGPLVAAYLLALGAGLVLTTPGGVGPFEVALLALLPATSPEPLLAAVLAYRAVYYALPALIGAVLLARPPMRPPLPATANAALEQVDPRNLPLMVEAALDTAPRAESALLRHGRFDLLSNSRAWPTALVARSGQSLIMLGDPLTRDSRVGEVFEGLRDRARATLTAPVIYKCGARLAVFARRTDWALLPIAREAFLTPATFSTTGADRRQLRRKLRKAEAAGLTVTTIAPGDPVPLPLDEMEALAHVWAGARGGERGFSMGVWNPATLSRAAICLAHDPEGRLRGFITLHANRHEHTLDLMRQDPDAPDGIMYMLVTHAIAAAHAAHIPRVSLAAVPTQNVPGEPRLFTGLRALLDRASGARGLRQFKSAFAPRWETLYLAAPTRTALLLGALDITREILRPPPRPRP